MKRIRSLIANGLQLTGEDSCEIGAKDTTCSWGMCAHTEQHWEKDELLFPDRPYPKYKKRACPFCTDQSRSEGCFYHCRIFKGKEGKTVKTGSMSREQALQLYDGAIKRLEKELSKPAS